jgi:microsomal epoxide hydrolase
VPRLFCLLLAAALITVPASPQTPAGTSAFFTTSDGVRLHYLSAGAGRTIVLVPGWTMPAEIWREQLRDLSRDFHVVALDPRSQGESAQVAEGHYPERRADDMSELIAHLKVPRVTLAGWSLAVPEVLTYVERHGTSKLEGVVLVDGFVGSDPNPSAPNPMRPILLGAQRDRKKFTADFVRSMFRSRQTPEYLERLTQMSLRTPTNTAFTLLANLMLTSGDWRPILAKLDKPVLYVVQPALAEQAKLAKAAQPAARVEIFEGAGHALFVDAADRFNALLREFVNALPR